MKFLAQLNLPESGNASWVQTLRKGVFKHPVYGKLDINDEKLQRLAQSVKNNARGIQLDVDYDHKMDPSKGMQAAGWIKDAEVRDGSLWLYIDWTPDAADAIRSKKYQYISADFSDVWENPETKEKIKDVLNGAGLTNRPFIKNMLPINLNEFFASDTANSGGDSAGDTTEDEGSDGPPVVEGESMDEKLKKLLIKRYGLKEDATDQEVLAAATEDESLSVKASESGAGTPPVGGTTQPVGGGEDPMVAKLREVNPQLAEHFERQQREIAALKASNRLSETNTKLAELNAVTTENKKQVAVPPVVVKQLREVMVSVNRDTADKVFELVKKFAEVGAVPLGEEAGSDPTRIGGGDNILERIETEANKLMEANKDLDYDDAVQMVFEDNPHLFNEWINSEPASGVRA